MQLLPSTTISCVTPEQCAAELLDALPPVMRVVRKHMRSHRTHGLSLPQFRAMCFLASTPAAKLLAVAEFLGASMPTTSRIISGLVSKGFVHRCEQFADRRCVDLALTARGRSVMEKARRATSRQLAAELAALDHEQRKAVLLGMQSLRSLFAPPVRLASGG
jgi:DNA-binding MarR family transcriptional regulator